MILNPGLQRVFYEQFDRDAAVGAQAPGRVNLMGERRSRADLLITGSVPQGRVSDEAGIHQHPLDFNYNQRLALCLPFLVMKENANSSPAKRSVSG